MTEIVRKIRFKVSEVFYDEEEEAVVVRMLDGFCPDEQFLSDGYLEFLVAPEAADLFEVGEFVSLDIRLNDPGRFTLKALEAAEDESGDKWAHEYGTDYED